MKKCPECVEGVVVEERRYARPPAGPKIFDAGTKRAWPLRDPASFEVEVVEVPRSCCRCGGRGEL